MTHYEGVYTTPWVLRSHPFYDVHEGPSLRTVD